MALHVEVHQSESNRLYFEGRWDDGRFWGEFVIPRREGMTAAETVELFFLERDMVASWLWVKHPTYLHGQFVRNGGAKEVSDSKAREIDL